MKLLDGQRSVKPIEITAEELDALETEARLVGISVEEYLVMAVKLGITICRQDTLSRLHENLDLSTSSQTPRKRPKFGQGCLRDAWGNKLRSRKPIEVPAHLIAASSGTTNTKQEVA